MSVLRLGMCTALDQDNLDKLKLKNINKATDFISKDPEEIAELCSIPYKDAVAIRKILLAQYSAVPINGKQLYTRVVESSCILSTGCERLDAILDGGLYTGEVTEVCGGVAAGKTQEDQTAVCIDTNCSFSARRLEQMMADDVDKDNALFRVHAYDAFTYHEVLEVLETLKSDLKKGDDPFCTSLRLLVVDNVASVIYPSLGGGFFADNQGGITRLGLTLKSIASEFSIAVLISNNNVTGEGGAKVASLGRQWSQIPHVRFMLDGGEETQDERSASVIKNTRGAIGACTKFSITENGPLR
ncbi:RA51D-like protein [Mya arenaria]|uniref:RA51D-like protein n=1 Tax=Mya arenaria TaxID=6604 RepID=A0ABY7DUW1_MYAAR|nr:RA51D-like protein [Mya arenaria]